MKRANLILLFIVFFSLTISAQKSEWCKNLLYGKVIDEHDKSPLPFAALLLKEINRSTVSDSLGNYVFVNVCDGTYTIIIEHVGCERVQKTVEVKGNTIIDFYAEHHTEQLKVIEVSELSEQHLQTHTASGLDDKQLLKNSGQPLGEMLKEIPGITSLQVGSSIVKPVIQGLHSNRILIFNNGTRQEGQQWGADHAPELDPFTSQKLTVLKGAMCMRYGPDAIAGVILSETLPIHDSVGINGAFNVVGATNGKQGTFSGYTQMRLNKLKPLGIRIQGTYKKGGTLKSPDYYLKNTGLNENNFSWLATWTKKKYELEMYYSRFNTRIGILSSSHIGNLTDLQKAIDGTIPLELTGFSYTIDRPYQQAEHELFRTKAIFKFLAIGKLSLTYARQFNLRLEYDKHRPLNNQLAALNKPEFQLMLTTHNADAVFEHVTIKRFKGIVGYSGLFQKNTYEGRFFIPNYLSIMQGVYLIEQWEKDKLNVELGIRYDSREMSVYQWKNNVIVNDRLHFKGFSGTVGAGYLISEKWNLKGSTGMAWRAPGINELYSNGLHHSTASIEMGDTLLNIEKAYNSSITFECTGKTKIQITPYCNWITNFINLIPDTTPALTIHGAFPVFTYKQVDARLIGLDVFASMDIFKSTTAIAKVSLLNAHDLTNNNWLPQIPSNRGSLALRYSLKDSKKVTGTSIESEFSYVSKQWKVPGEIDLKAPPASYWLLNLYVATRLNFRKSYIDIGLNCQNMFDKKYRDYLDRFRYFADATGRNISLKVKIPFAVGFNKE